MISFCEKLKVGVFSILILGCLSINISAQVYEPDYPESLGTCLGIYKIHSKTYPKEFSDFDYFYFDKFPKQDTNNPKRDLQKRVFILGEVKLKNRTILKIKRAFVRSININGDEDYYKDIEFETEEVNGMSYKFKGEFLEKKIYDKENGGFTKVKGRLAKYKDGKKIIDAKLSFYEYAEL